MFQEGPNCRDMVQANERCGGVGLALGEFLFGSILGVGRQFAQEFGAQAIKALLALKGKLGKDDDKLLRVAVQEKLGQHLRLVTGVVSQDASSESAFRLQ